MLYMKEDDMDEMMRKAAENYHVDAESAADWNAVAAAVHTHNEAAPAEPQKKKRRFAFWWLLLIPLGWIAHTEYNKFSASYNSAKKDQPVATTQPKPVVENTTKNNQAKQKQTISRQQNFYNEKNVALTRQDQPAINQSNKKITKAIVIKETVSNQTQTSATENTTQTTVITSSNLAITNNNVKKEIAINDDAATLKDTAINIAASPLSNVDLTKNSITDSTSQIKNDATMHSKKSAKQTTGNNHHFYVGIVAGGDLSFIHFQQSRSVGLNAGILAGYKFNKLSIESGFFIDKKNYYTAGDYFNKSKIAYFNDATILTADGYCKMFEIPLNIKYDFSIGKKHAWFATAGFSSYIMNKEFYKYDYIKNGVQQYGSKPYYHTTKDWFSVANISAGYQLQINSKANFRVEPYYKIPFVGVGTGKLHITSLGLNIGLTKSLR